MTSAGRGRGALLVAGLLGSLHAAFSLYWGAGGHWLVETLGQRMADAFTGWEWLLLPIGLLKLVAAWVPLLAARAGWPVRRLSRGACWVGATVLVAWGGLNTVVGQLVLAGAVVPDGGVDRAGMVGHAYLWDPLFLLWGLVLAAGLARSRA
ncbi:DUF3995 domain-containing protein [Nocardioides sp. zg-1228]|uniref:DUF3995 domain-containing protein n=1 Tax=Nocardioides sp. zg-1228 TaxID=2763008 RepID=UPI001642CF37|nr:DUF3995 domain-containing protein [Nocardioides sp. zg-1228]MBC2933640.1 DUF3995 domain-containing protein [Nocardioides sp. zg-1228]QSF56239.1 DUF3995 domain-containing protein [Nocardioides sp. zg-1228]